MSSFHSVSSFIHAKRFCWNEHLKGMVFVILGLGICSISFFMKWGFKIQFYAFGVSPFFLPFILEIKFFLAPGDVANML